ncbi:phage minor capsid protein [Solobacterium moorei]|uniref:phage minor capsid protein n=1 Tax=Solobacterium moorei TaxID=102148 RepID=UPI00040638DF|nr:phage minor capsid protein [Solobacterium moorei]BET22458.1 hypothetical protein RGT18_20460 [Solobacterium moorei]
MCSKTCQPWQGRVYVDDVYSGGTPEEAEELNLPLLSTAISGGLFHPNCKHHLSTYYPGMDNDDDGDPRQPTYENPPGSQEHHYLQHQIQRERRLQVGSLSEDKIREHADKEQRLIGLDEKYVKQAEQSSSTTDYEIKLADNEVVRKYSIIFKGYDPAELIAGSESYTSMFDKFGFNRYVIRRRIVNAATPPGETNVDIGNPALANSLHERAHDLINQLAMKNLGLLDGMVLEKHTVADVNQEKRRLFISMFENCFSNNLSFDEIMEEVKNDISLRATDVGELISEALTQYFGGKYSETSKKVYDWFVKEWLK